ncbi:hypothetical protein CC78DRAFT_568470 [Lojkania enalia]|uniref:Uncharacterized protein n=1 Tax=Lojkania enalia TaxID=147567 RepID=A0A9P4K9E0_9PLEO|nr:hypothetical protein CC78DRAFT_568470 [Didymosphaeria enalia]
MSRHVTPPTDSPQGTSNRGKFGRQTRPTDRLVVRLKNRRDVGSSTRPTPLTPATPPSSREKSLQRRPSVTATAPIFTATSQSSIHTNSRKRKKQLSPSDGDSNFLPSSLSSSLEQVTTSTIYKHYYVVKKAKNKFTTKPGNEALTRGPRAARLRGSRQITALAAENKMPEGLDEKGGTDAGVSRCVE